ncbi:MAG: hypothetical protein U9Q03_00365 [Patescibacteria group bacterium]|nr:hypothetical protein [Patescibacteria group bacterium]
MVSEHETETLLCDVLRTFEEVLKQVCGQDTASPGDAADWSAENPTKGHCAVFALLFQEIFGGELMRTVPEGFGSHYYNMLPHGTLFGLPGNTHVDLTWDQFPDGTVFPAGEPRDRDYVLNSDAARNAGTPERYELFKHRFWAALAAAALKGLDI